MPEIGYRTPEVPEHYEMSEIEGIKVYVMKNVTTTANKLEFVVNKFMFIASLEVRGIRTKTF